MERQSDNNLIKLKSLVQNVQVFAEDKLINLRIAKRIRYPALTASAGHCIASLRYIIYVMTNHYSGWVEVNKDRKKKKLWFIMVFLIITLT